jgi:hypothetical protein
VIPDDLLASARESTGLDDFGDDELFGGDGWRDGLALLLRCIEDEARFSDLGEMAAGFELSSYLANRLRIVNHHREHPEIRDRDVVPPVIIVGQARTGTTLLFDLLAQDRAHRAPLTWEVEVPLPPPRTQTYYSDPRIDEAEALISVTDTVIPGFRAIHQLGGRLAQECGRILGSAFTSTIFANQYRVPSYLRWWLHDAVRDGHVAAAYTWHRRFLEVLQSEHPGERWLLKWPSHVWTLPQLMGEYPGALLVQTHRDVATLVASNTSMVGALRRLYSDEVDRGEVGPEFAELLLEGSERTVDVRLDGTVPAGQVVDIPFAELMADPLATVQTIYDRFGFELPDPARARMAGFLRDNPRAASGHSYTFADTGLDLADVRARTARYAKYFDVAEEPN